MYRNTGKTPNEHQSSSSSLSINYPQMSQTITKSDPLHYEPDRNVENRNGGRKKEKYLCTFSQKQKRQIIFEELSSGNLNIQYFSDEYDQTWARCEVNGAYMNLEINSKGFIMLIRKQIWDAWGIILSQSMAKEMIDLLSSMALFDGPKVKLHYRCAWRNDELWIDRGSEDWSAINVTANGWRIVNGKEVPTAFKRHSHMQALPLPTKGGSLELLKPYIRLPDNATWSLMKVWVIAAFIPNIARAGIIFHGQQGSGKSFTSKILRTLIDPSITALLPLPKGNDELALQLDHHYLLAFDNLGKLPQWASDSLCRAISGGAFSKRKLQSDCEDIILSFMRPFLLNGINLPATAPDLLDRSILVELGRISPKDRQSEQDIMSGFEKIRPELFAAILDGLSGAMKLFPDVQIERLPRMADFARWAYAIAEAIGIGGDTFLSHYLKNTKTQHYIVIHNDLVASSLLDFAMAVGEYCGTATELQERCKEYLSEDDVRDRSWPKGANHFSRRVKQVSHNLKELGVHIESSRGKDRNITLKYET